MGTVKHRDHQRAREHGGQRPRTVLVALVGIAAVVTIALILRWGDSSAGPAAPRAGAAAPADPVGQRLGCRDVAEDVGLAFDNPYGPVVAESENGIVMQRNMGNGAAVGDYDRDGDLDVYLLAQAGYASRLYRNELIETGAARFVDVTGSAGVVDEGLGRVAHFADLDNDGWLDLLVVNDHDPQGVLSPSRLFRNRRDGTFEDVTSGSGFEPLGYLVGGASLADYDADGDLDVYVTYWTREMGGSPIGGEVAGEFPGRNTLYANEGGFRFVDATSTSGLGELRIDSFTSVFHDFDRDGDLDFFVAVDHRPDRYFEQVGGRFVDASREAWTLHRGNDMGVAVADVDRDEDFDLFVTNVFDPEQVFGVRERTGNTLLMNELRPGGGVRFVDEAEERGVYESAWGWGTAFTDIDLDGDLDLFAVQGFDEFVGEGRALHDARAHLFRNDGSGYFTQLEGSGCDVEGDQRSLIPFDYDRDGDADFLVTQVGLPVMLLENLSEGNALAVVLEGDDAANVGAVVQVETSEGPVRQLILAGGSYLSGPPREAYFGLGDAQQCQVRVIWPGGQVKTFANVEAGTTLRVSAPAA